MRLLRTPPILLVALSLGLIGLVLSGPPQQPVVYGQGSAEERFPFESLSDWASYAHQLSVVTVVGESELPPPDPPQSHGGYVGRSVVLRIDETLWTTPGEVAVAGEIDSIVWGWMLRGSTLRPVNFGSGPRLEVGRSYLIALVPLERGDWGQMTGSSVLPLQGDRVPEAFRTVHPVASQLVGLTTAEITRLLEAAPPDPIAERFRHLDPVERVRKVLEIRHESVESEQRWTLPGAATPTPTAIELSESEATYVPGGQRTPPDPPAFNGYEEFGPGGQQPFVDSSPITWLPPPDSLHAMVDGADAIVIGTVTGFLREANEGAYAPDGTLQSPREMAVNDQGGELFPHPGVPSSYFAVEIERILLHDGRLEENDSFALRLYGLNSDPSAQPWPLPVAGQRLLLVLGVNPDGQSYSTGPWGQIDVAGSQPTYQDWEHSPVAFADGMSPAAFVAALERLVDMLAFRDDPVDEAGPVDPLGRHRTPEQH